MFFQEKKRMEADFKAKMHARMQARAMGCFDSKAAIFDYLHFFEGMPVAEADAEAALIASAKGVPDTPTPKKNIMETVVGFAKQGYGIYKDNPDIIKWLGAGAVALMGMFGGAAIANSNTADNAPKQPDPRWDEEQESPWGDEVDNDEKTE